MSLSLALSSCSLVGSRPVQQMAYAEAAMQAATVANAETHPEASQVYLLAKDQMARARSYYRLKNFRLARNLAFRARKLAEEAEWKAIKGAGGGDGGNVESLVK